jgi:hypothetical protein
MQAKNLVRIFLPLLILWLAACGPKSTVAPRAEKKTVEVPAKATFVGDEACKPCHAAEFTSHRAGRHKLSLFDTTKSALGTMTPPEGETASNFALQSIEDQLTVMIRLPQQTERNEVPLSLAIGSGKSGMTYMIFGKSLSAVLGQSYFPSEKKWHATPGQEDVPKNQPGGIYNTEKTRECLRCHVVTLPPNSMVPEKRFYGIGCESCHGEGSRHVALMQNQSKSANIGLRSLIGMGGKEMNALCGRCHQTTEMVLKMDKKYQKSTNRFQPYGLSLSKCFLKSNNALTCSTCHNPHQNAETDPKHYEAVCVDCHSGVSKAKKACPVNPREKCVSCHMPSRAVFPNTAVTTQMADHFIRIYKNLPP